MTTQKPSRRETILQALVELLQNDPGSRITTAGLAKTVGVTEAALYRHFPSKRKMFEALIESVCIFQNRLFSDCLGAHEEAESKEI